MVFFVFCCNWDFISRMTSYIFVQLEDELNKAKCILVDGDASSFLAGKVDSACHLFSPLEHYSLLFLVNI